MALAPLLLAVKNVRPGVAARLGLLAGMVHYVSLLYWIVIVLGKYGNLPLWVSLPALLLLSLPTLVSAQSVTMEGLTIDPGEPEADGPAGPPPAEHDVGRQV